MKLMENVQSVAILMAISMAVALFGLFYFVFKKVAVLSLCLTGLIWCLCDLAIIKVNWSFAEMVVGSFLAVAFIELLYYSLYPWMGTYRNLMFSGTREEEIFDKACEETKFRPPKFILLIVPRFVYRIYFDSFRENGMRMI